MTTTQTRNGKAVREYNAAVRSLADAEDLLAHLQACPLACNFYFDRAVEDAEALVREMTDNLEHVMGTYSPEECGL